MPPKFPRLKRLCEDEFIIHCIDDLKDESKRADISKTFNTLPTSIREKLLIRALQLNIFNDNCVSLWIQTIQQTSYFVASCSQLSDIGFKIFADSCENISKLDLSHCYKLEDASFCLLTRFQNLVYLDLEDTSINPPEFKALNGLNRLSYVNVNNCINLTYEDIVEFLKGIKEIEIFHYDQIPQWDYSEASSESFGYIYGINDRDYNYYSDDEDSFN